MDFKLRRGTSAEWAAANPVLPDGVMGFDRTLGNVKIGNGSSPWSALNWAGGEKGDKGDRGLTGPAGPTGAAGIAWSETHVEIAATVQGYGQGLVATVGTPGINDGYPIPGMLYIVSGLQSAVTAGGGVLGSIDLSGEIGYGSTFFPTGQTQFLNVLVLNDTTEDCVITFTGNYYVIWTSGPAAVAPALSYALINVMVVSRTDGSLILASAVGG